MTLDGPASVGDDPRHSPTCDPEPDRRHKRELLGAARLALALGVSLVAIGTAWVTRPDRLELPGNIVGYPAFHDFDYRPMFLAHRLFVWVLPLTTALVYWLLTRVGPLRVSKSRITRTRRDRGQLADRSRRRCGDQRPLWTDAMSAVPAAGLIVIAVSAGTQHLEEGVDRAGLLAGAGFLAVLTLTGLTLAHFRSRFADAVSWVNVVAIPTGSFAALWWFTHSSGTVDASGEFRQWSWLPWWAATLLLASTLGWAGWQLHHRQARQWVTRSLASVVSGGVAVFMVTTRLAGPIPRLNGFDDSHAVTGADLLTRGYFPWRDVLFLHGTFEDALRGNVGFWLFEHTIWGVEAANYALWVPLVWLGYYLLLVWLAPRSWVLHLAFVAIAAWASTWMILSIRWGALGFVLVLLGRALSLDRTRPTVVMTGALFAFAILVPEASFLVLAVTVVLIVHDLVRIGEDARGWRRLRRTGDFIVTGVLLTLAFTVFLGINHALRSWIEYYLYFGPGHVASGALPWRLASNGSWNVVFAVSECLVVVGLSWGLAVLLSRREFTPSDGLLLATAITTGLYAEKALGRYDVGHIWQALTVAIALWLVLVVKAVEAAGDRLAMRVERQHAPVRRANARARILGWSPWVPAVAVLIAGAVVAPLLVDRPTAVGLIKVSPSHNTAAVPSQDGNPELIGYSAGTDMTMVDDLSKILDTLAPPGTTIYDFTNSPGYFTYLMQEELPTRLYTVGLALPEVAQKELRDDLERADPSVVVFDSLDYGLPMWDDLRNEVRHYLVSPYLLDNWTPVLLTHGFLIMVRNDLIDDLPPLPSISAPVQTSDLYFSMPECAWGHIPDFLHPAQESSSRSVDVGRYSEQRKIRAVGWAYDRERGQVPGRLLGAIGSRVVAQQHEVVPRQDVAERLGDPAATSAGFVLSGLAKQRGRVDVYAVLADGLAHSVGRHRRPLPPLLNLPDGSRVAVSPLPVAGSLDVVSAAHYRVAEVRLPTDLDLSQVGQVTFTTDGKPLGPTDVAVFDDPAAPGLSRNISFRALPRSGDNVSVRVGACLQWHGYSGDRLFLMQRGGHPVTKLRFGTLTGS